MSADIINCGTPLPIRIKIIASRSYLTLWTDDEWFDVSVRLTRDAARALAEQLLAHCSPGARGPSVTAGPTGDNVLHADDPIAAIDAADRGGVSKQGAAGSPAGIDVLGCRA